MARKQPTLAIDPEATLITPVDIQLVVLGPLVASKSARRILPGFVADTVYNQQLARWKKDDAEWERLNKTGQATGPRPEQPLPRMQTEEEISIGNTLIFPRAGDGWPLLPWMWLFPGAAKQGAATAQSSLGYLDDDINHCIKLYPDLRWSRLPSQPGDNPSHSPIIPFDEEDSGMIEQTISTRPRPGQPPTNVVRQGEIVYLEKPWVVDFRVRLVGDRISPDIFMQILSLAVASGIGGGRNYGYGLLEVGPKGVTVHPPEKRPFPVIRLDQQEA